MEGNILNVIVRVRILGMMEFVLVQQNINIHVQEPDIRVVQELIVMENMLNVLVKVDIRGVEVAVLRSHPVEELVAFHVAMIRDGDVYVLRMVLI